MKKMDLDLVFTQGNNMHLGGYVRWFTDVPAEYNFHMTVLFPKQGEMTLIRSSASRIPEWGLRGVEDVCYAPISPSLCYTADSEADFAISYIKKMNPKRVGYIGPALINTGFMLRVRAAFPKVELVNITDEFDMIKAMKSPEEMELVREAARTHDSAFSALPAIIKPGMYEYQIRAEVIKLLMDLGSEEHLVFMGTNEPGKPCGMCTFQYANRRMNEGDYGTILIEVSGPGGEYCESARNFCFGEPYPALQKAWDFAAQAQQFTADMLVPGRPACEIVDKYNKLVSEKGYSQEGRLYGHSQGYDLIERPAFMASRPEGNETMMIKAGMNISLHPYFIDSEQTVYINDNYYVTEKGAEKIHKTPPEIILL
ncbi:MAG: M24 family metallopeptidase [Oscillospiraceae bacterium]|nr:M24 family metallopeptidase [Oscillospiraceae bacterium]